MHAYRMYVQRVGLPQEEMWFSSKSVAKKYIKDQEQDLDSDVLEITLADMVASNGVFVLSEGLGFYYRYTTEEKFNIAK